MIRKTNANTEREITIGKILLLTLNEQEEKVIDKIIAAIADCISLDAIQTISVPASGMTFPGLEIRQSQRRVFQGGEEVNLTRLEYSTLVFLASNPTFDKLKAQFGIPDVLFYNAGITGLDAEIKEAKDIDLLMNRYMVDVAGAYHAIGQVLGEEFSQKSGAVLVTGGGLALNPMYEYLPLSMDKAALRAMCIALHEELKKQNVFVGTVTVTGVIAPGEACDPALLAEDFWKLYTERKECEIVH